MKRVATAVVLIPIVLLIVFRAPLWLFAAIVALVALLATREYLDIAQLYGLRPFRAAVYVVLVLGFVLAGALGMQSDPGAYLLGTLFFLAILLGIAGLMLLIIAMAQQELSKALPSAAVSMLALAYIVPPLVGIVSLRGGAGGWLLVVYLLVLVWIGDIFAYYAGTTIGRHKLAPRISPNKTWEGAIASFIGAVAVGFLYVRFSPQIAAGLVRMHLVAENETLVVRPLWIMALVSAAINVAAQAGDLVESMLKRGAGLKDSGTLLPGHGGMLDRIDALLFAAPVLWYYAAISAALSGS